MSENNGTLNRWAINLVLLAVVALASVAVADNRKSIEKLQATDNDFHVLASERAVRLALLEDRYETILKRLDSIDRKLDNQQRVSGSSSTRKPARPSNEESLHGFPLH